jgi:heme/copper-type cytochrome/quinol oxidase subunit 2
MEWIPAIFVTFKFVVLVTGMFFAIKWHYDQGKKGKEMRSVLRASGTVAAIFMLSLLGLALFTFLLIKMLGMDLTTIV